MIILRQDDCLNVMADLEDKCIDFALLDPPYNWPEAKRNLYHAEIKRVTRGAIAIFCPPENLWQPCCDQTLFWIKPTSTKNTRKSYSRFVEVIQLWSGPVWNYGRHWTQYTNLFYDLVDSTVHPYKKPDSMITRLILNHSNPGQMVFDGFFGSGTTPRLADALGRDCIASEIDHALYEEVAAQYPEAK